MKVVCVLRSGGCYTHEYVLRLRDAVVRHGAGMPFSFVCLTDVPNPTIKATQLPLEHDWPGWWSKLEVFKLQGPVLFLDLDTVITGSISILLGAVRNLRPDQVLLLRSFKREMWMSGVMAWGGDRRAVYQNFRQAVEDGRLRFGPGDRATLRTGQRIAGDQDWLAQELTSAPHLRVRSVQGAFMVPQCVRSYKHHCRSVLPVDTRMVCFHGRPRPHEVATRHSWMREHWLGEGAPCPTAA